MDAVTHVPFPLNEPVLTYAPGTPERADVEAKLAELAAQQHQLTCTIGGAEKYGGGDDIDQVQPHARATAVGTMGNATQDDARAAIAAAKEAAPAWRALSYDDRAAIFLKAAELAAGPWRQVLNASTMLGQSKTIQQAEIDAACELIDFWRFNVHFGREILEEQPMHNAKGVWNRTDWRPLEGFVYAITPFNFTAIGGNLPTAPALMGNTVIWKPSPTQQLSAHFTMRLLEAAGLPPGVINMLTGDGIAVSDVALHDPDLAGLHFTGSAPTFHLLWRTIGENISSYRNFPRIVGETGGKDFIVAHPSADPEIVKIAMVRGAYEYQGQKCSAASRAYVARSVWDAMRDDVVSLTESLSMGDVTDLSNFMGAVIDDRAFAKQSAALERAAGADSVTILAGGTASDEVGYFVQPTLLECTDPENEVFTDEYFGPILAVHVYDDGDYDAMLAQMESVASQALTGAIIAQDRAAIVHAQEALRFAAGNFYVNDKPTGSIVGQQPFGGARASGTNDKAGSAQNLLRWASARSIKETFDPPRTYTYPHMG
jgi:1-pyrroline-5-carboxylate dehydrogenase